MATIEAVRALCAWMSGTFGDQVAAKVSGRYADELVEDLAKFTDADLEAGRRIMRAELNELPPWTNITPVILEHVKAGREERRDAERASAAELEARQRELEDLYAQLRPISPEEQAILDGPEPENEYEIRLHRRRVACIRKRMGISIHARNELSRRRREIEASGVTLLLEDDHAA